MEQRAQGAIEYLLIIGAAILVVAVVVLALTAVMGAAKSDSNGSINDYNADLNVLRHA